MRASLYRIQYNLTVLFCFIIAGTFAQSKQHFPRNHYVSGTSQIDFYWDTEVGADSYELQIAADQIFSINLRSYSGLTNDSQTVNLNQDSVYYWRMRSVTSGIPGAWSETRKLTIINPNSFGTLSLWLNPESNVAISSGKVTQWDDNTSNANHALQSNTNFQPTFVDSIKEINNHGAIRMDGTNDFLEFNALSGIRSVLVVINKDQPEGPSDIRPFLGHDSQFDFYRANEFLWTGSTHSNVKNGLSRINKTVIPNPGNTTVLPVGYNLISINTLGPTDAQNISRDFTISNRVWSGDYVEVMLYESLLSDSLLQLTEDYLIDKYTAHLDLPRVVNVDYGFCETDLEVAEGFVSYSWFKDGQNLNIDSNIIAVNAPGLYRVEATSVFGVTYADSVQVSYPVPISGLSDTTFCQYDSVGFASNVSTSIYSLSWSNGSVDSAIYIKQATDLSVTFTDTNGCKFESDTITLDMDSFPSSIDLGNDTNLCKGNIITLISGAFQSVSYLWSTGSTNTSISIDSTKYYSVTVSNVSGCVGVDSIFITIKGDAPIVDFSVDSSCFSDSILFTNLSTSTIGIDSIFWSFGDGGSDTNMNPKHLYSDSGLYNVSLYVETDSGCSASNNKPFRVFGNPVVSFSISSNIGCTGLNYQFTSAIQTFYNDTINSYVWDFGDGNGSSQNSPSHNYSSSNTYQVTLLATSIYGCSYSDTVLFEVNDTYPQPLNFNLVSPMNGSSVVGDSVQFNWNTSQEAFSYIIQVASDPLFGNVLITQNVSTTSAELAVLNANASNYWRVIALTPCLDSTFSEVFEFNHVEMSQLGMELWLHPEAGIDTSSGPVALWQDMSFSQHDAVQPSVGVMPNFIQNNFEINDHSSIQFDGVDDYLDFGSIDSIRTVFIVAKEDLYANAPAPRSLLAHPSAFDFYRNDSTFYGSAANNLIENGTTKLNKNTIDGRTTVVPSEYFIYSCQSLGNVRAQNLSWDNLVPGRVWSGEYVEVMIFDSALSDSTVELINDYLRFKYVKPVNIGNDIDIPYGFCDTTISVEGHYKSYQWFFDDVALVGATQNQISASNSGEYKVVVTDIFGFTHSDSLLVLFPGNFSDFIDTTICLDDTIVVSAQVGNGYTFNWSNGNTAESSSLFVNDTVSVMISDTLGCSFQSDSFVVSLDSFKTFVILASDTQICSGNSIGIESGASLISDYLWSNGDTTEKTDISTSNLYFLTATNSRGCAFVDTIDVTINGTAPVTGFTFQSVCQGDSTIFIDTSYTVDNSNIVQWSWAFGDGDSSILDNPKHLYLDTGLYTVTLNTLTDSGCSNENSGIIQINPNPMADFSTTSNVQCLGTHTVFLNQSVSQGSIDSLSWDFGVSGSSTDTSSITNPNYLYGAIGQYPVTLVAYSTNGCVDTLIKTIEIHDIPAPDFLFS
ncbi:MAG: PKD domain-containing protein, partial [Flavobacteriales bacterium]|nr:PKD domain-containing protein [Flavobacteriales bacterium]